MTVTVEIPAHRSRALDRYRREPLFHDAIDTAARASTYTRSQLLRRAGPARIVLEAPLLGVQDHVGRP